MIGLHDAHTLWREELFPMGIRLLEEAVAEIASGILTQIDHDHAIATWEPSLNGAPRLHRPELPQLGSLSGGFVIRKE